MRRSALPFSFRFIGATCYRLAGRLPTRPAGAAQLLVGQAVQGACPALWGDACPTHASIKSERSQPG